MVDPVILRKAATIQRCVARAREELAKDPPTFVTDFTRQDAAILNIQRACQSALDLATAVIRRRRIGIPASARDYFQALVQAGMIDQALAANLQKMAGFRNIVVHDYQTIEPARIVGIIETQLDDLLRFSALIVTSADS